MRHDTRFISSFDSALPHALFFENDILNPFDTHTLVTFAE